MPAGKHKSRTLRRVKVRTPGSRLTLHYEKRKPGKPICGQCGSPLHGVPHLIASKFRKLSKSKKRPTRPFGGVLCSICSKKEVITRAESILKKMEVMK